MPIIRDGKTPNGRLVKCRPTLDMTSECRTRMMTEEERAFYGGPVPPSEWKKMPAVISMSPGKPPARRMKFVDDDDFRSKIKRERLRRNMTQERIGNFAKMSNVEYSKIERGVKKLTPDLKKRICDVFGWEEE